MNISTTPFVIATLMIIPASSPAALLVNGDFAAPAILGSGQTQVAEGTGKLICTDTSASLFATSILGVSGWTYATPNPGGSSDHGLMRRNALFGLPAGGQFAFINNWNRMMSQTVQVSVSAGETVLAGIDFGTLGSDSDNGRAGRFYLVAGEADPGNPDQFSARSIVLDEISIANPSWSQFVADVLVGNQQFVPVDLSYTYQANDPALGLPLTVAFRTEIFSVGPTYWDNAEVSVVPEPSVCALLGFGMIALLRRNLRSR